jgi:hypothetical protein
MRRTARPLLDDLNVIAAQLRLMHRVVDQNDEGNGWTFDLLVALSDVSERLERTHSELASRLIAAGLDEETALPPGTPQ